MKITFKDWEKKIIDETRLEALCQKLKKENKSIVTTNGAFDLFHYGHLKTLKFASEKGDILIVGINSDASIKKYKSDKRPIIPEKERALVIASIIFVDYVVIFSDENPIGILGKIKPDVHVKGSEYKDNMIERDVVQKNNGKIEFIERDPADVSTSKIIEKLLTVYR